MYITYSKSKKFVTMSKKLTKDERWRKSEPIELFYLKNTTKQDNVILITKSILILRDIDMLFQKEKGPKKGVQVWIQGLFGETNHYYFS